MNKLPLPLEFDCAVHIIGPALRLHRFKPPEDFMFKQYRMSVAAEANVRWLYDKMYDYQLDMEVTT